MFIISKMFDIKFQKNTSLLFSIVSLTFITLFFFYYFILDTVNVISKGGYSQIEAINLLSGELNSNSYAFTSTAEAKKNSILTWAYYVISKITQTSGLNLIVFFKFLELLIIPISVKFLLDSLKIYFSIQKSILFLAIPVLSTIAYKNWANYGQIFSGEWYQFPHYLYFFSIGCIVRKNYINSILILFLIYLIHPAKGFALIFATAPLILQLINKNKENLNLKKHYIFILTISVISGIFSFIILPKNISLMRDDLWIDITSVHSSHVLQGTFDYYFVILSLFPIFILSIGIFLRLKETDLKYLSLSLFSVSLVGKIYDSFGSNPAVLKLILHRTTENIILLSILFIISKNKKLDYKFEVLEFGAFYILINKQNILAINIEMVLFGVFYFLLLVIYKNKNDVTLSLIYCLLIFQTYFFNSDIFYILVLAFLVMLFKDDKLNNYISIEYSGHFFLIFYILAKFGTLIDYDLYSKGFVFFFLILFILYTVIFQKFKLKNFLTISFISGLTTFLIFINIYGYKLSSEKFENIFSQRTNGYYEAQIWAKYNTPVSSIFFPDPKFSYAWRDFSNRNSFGTPREFVTSWTYTQNQDLFYDSTKRLGIFVDDPINTMLTWDKAGYINHVAKIYYTSDLSLYKKLTEEWKVDYFLWSKEFNLPTFFTIVHETDSHYILKLN